MKRYLSAALCATLLLLTACQPYQMDISQGKKLTPDKIARLQVGMSKEAVLADLGAPLQGTSPFDENRLDYLYTMQKNGGKIEEKRLSIYLKNNIVTRIAVLNQVISP